MYLRNTANQHVGFCMISATDGSVMTGLTVTARRVLDNGSQATATGSVVEKGNGQYDFALSQADTNAETASYLFTATGAVAVEKTIGFFRNYDGIATGGGSSSITLQGGWSTDVNSYVGWRIALIDESDNVGRGQARTVTAFNPSTGVATVDRAWEVVPDATSKYAWSTPADIPSYVRDAIADSTLVRSVATVEATMPEHCLGSSVLALLEWTISGTTWTIRRTDGVTTHVTKTLTAGSGLNSITGIQ